MEKKIFNLSSSLYTNIKIKEKDPSLSYAYVSLYK